MDKDMMLWIRDGNVVKGELNFETGTVVFYDKFDNILLKRDGLTRRHLLEIKTQIQKQLNKRNHVGLYYV